MYPISHGIVYFMPGNIEIVENLMTELYTEFGRKLSRKSKIPMNFSEMVTFLHDQIRLNKGWKDAWNYVNFFTAGVENDHARPFFKDRKKFSKIADPLLQGRYPMRGLYQALAVAAMCLQPDAEARPIIGDVVTALSYLASQTYDPNSNQNISISAFMEKEARKSNGDSSGRQKKKGWQF